MKNIKTILALLVLAVLFFSACTMEKRKYNNGYYVSWNKQKHPLADSIPSIRIQHNVADSKISVTDPAFCRNTNDDTVPGKTNTVFPPKHTLIPKINLSNTVKINSRNNSGQQVDLLCMNKKSAYTLFAHPSIPSQPAGDPGTATNSTAKTAMVFAILALICLLLFALMLFNLAATPPLFFIALAQVIFSLVAIIVAYVAQGHCKPGDANWLKAQRAKTIGYICLILPVAIFVILWSTFFELLG